MLYNSVYVIHNDLIAKFWMRQTGRWIPGVPQRENRRLGRRPYLQG